MLNNLLCVKKNQLDRIHFFQTQVQRNFEHISFSSLSNKTVAFCKPVAVTDYYSYNPQSSHFSSCGDADKRSEGFFENIQLPTFHIIGGAFCQGCVHKPLDNFQRVRLF